MIHIAMPADISTGSNHLPASKTIDRLILQLTNKIEC